MKSLLETASEVVWLPYNSKVTPIALANNMKRDQRIYLLLTVSENEAVAFNHAGKRIGHLSLEEIIDFNDSFSSFKINTKAPTYAPDDETTYGVGAFFDAGLSAERDKKEDSKK